MSGAEEMYVPARPRGRGAMRMRWESLLFMHWPVPVEAVRAMRPRIPDGLEIDTFGGTAWIGLIPFTMRGVRPVWALGIPGVPMATNFHECNARTYVTFRGQPGVWFFSLDAASKLAVWAARRWFHLPYIHARMSLQRDGDLIRYSVRRGNDGLAELRCVWRAGAALPRAQAGELAHFVTERYMLYARSPHGELFRGRIWHDPWPLREAKLLELDDSLLAAAGFAIPSRESPVLHHADGLDVVAWRLEPV